MNVIKSLTMMHYSYFALKTQPTTQT